MAAAMDQDAWLQQSEQQTNKRAMGRLHLVSSDLTEEVQVEPPTQEQHNGHVPTKEERFAEFVAAAKQKEEQKPLASPLNAIKPLNEMIATVPPNQRRDIIELLLNQSSHTILTGKAKSRKSRLARYIATRVASGKPVFETLQTTATDVLYLCLEDRIEDAVDHLRTLCGGNIPPNLYVVEKWEELDSGGLEDLEQWVGDHPKCVGIIDMLVYIRKELGDYDQDIKAMKPLTDFAYEHGVSIISVTHSHKRASGTLDDTYGSSGVVGAVDNMLTLKKVRDNRIQVYAEGRNLQAIHLDVEDNGVTWDVVTPYAKAKASRERIYELLRKQGKAMQPHAIAKQLGRKNADATQKQLQALEDEGRVKNTGNGYYIAVVR